MKKIIYCLILIGTLIIISSCEGGANISKAKLKGYDGKTFNKTMEAAITASSKETGLNCSGEWRDGWIGNYAPDATFLTSDEKAMSYVVSTRNEFSSGVIEIKTMVYYMIHNIKDNTLSAKGAYCKAVGGEYLLDRVETQNVLKETFNEYN